MANALLCMYSHPDVGLGLIKTKVYFNFYLSPQIKLSFLKEFLVGVCFTTSEFLEHFVYETVFAYQNLSK